MKAGGQGCTTDSIANNSSIVRLGMNRIFGVILISSFLTAAAAAQTAAPQASTSPESKAPVVKSGQSVQTVDKAAAYYHYTLAHLYEEQVTAYGRSELANKAIEEYRLAIDADPSSEFLTSGLAELYVKTGRIRDAVIQAQDILKRDPNNIEAHKLLGRIYLRSLGDMPGNGNGSDNVRDYRQN
jgi:Flp pilus assembly protein TadD